MSNTNNQLLREIRFDWSKEEILEILKAAKKLGCKVITVYAFSTEN